jgi:hypothetical protein
LEWLELSDQDLMVEVLLPTWREKKAGGLRQISIVEDAKYEVLARPALARKTSHLLN